MAAYISTGQAAERLGVSDSYVRRLVRSGRLKARKSGSGNRATYTISVESLDSYQEGRTMK